MKKDTWLVVANSSIAKIYKVQRKQSLIEIEVLEHPESRLHTRDLVSDKPGRGFESMGTTRHAIEPATEPKQIEFTNFAKDVARYLEQARSQGSYDKLYLVASPTQLGLLRQQLHPSTAKLISGEVDKDMTHMKPNDIIAHLPFLL